MPLKGNLTPPILMRLSWVRGGRYLESGPKSGPGLLRLSWEVPPHPKTRQPDRCVPTGLRFVVLINHFLWSEVEDDKLIRSRLNVLFDNMACLSQASSKIRQTSFMFSVTGFALVEEAAKLNWAIASNSVA